MKRKVSAPKARSKKKPDPAVPLLGRYENLSKDKLRGGYYTSTEVAAWICLWAIRSKSDTVLEPSSGNGVFLEAAALRLLELGARKQNIVANLQGVEIVEAEAKFARNRVRDVLGLEAQSVVKTSDFFGWWQSNDKPKFDVVVGNPPFIRYQTFPEPHRQRAMDVMVDLGLSPNRLTNIWVPFVTAAVASLKPGGRLALVLPAELLQVTYAAQLRSFLTDRFKRIDIVACNELFFANAEQEVVLLLAEGPLEVATETNLCKVALTETGKVSEIINRNPAAVLASAETKTIHHDTEKWLKYFLAEREIAFMRELRASKNVTTLDTHAQVDVGVVTGKNQFFVLTNSQIEELGLEGFTIPLISRSAHLKGAKIGKTDWKALSADGDRVHLLNLPKAAKGKLTKALERYIKSGEKSAVHEGYKCSIREPWYAVPSIWTPDGFLFRQIYDFPRMVLNQAGATSTDTIHRITCRAEKPERVIANTYTWLTAASAEIEGRSYGGGVLELEPTEAERLLVPAKLNGAMPLAECDALIRAGKLEDVLEENGRIICKGHLGLSNAECQMLRDIWDKMRNRRLARRRKVNVLEAV